MAMQYNNPFAGRPSSIGEQWAEYYFNERAVRTIHRELVFAQMSDPEFMPLHHGLTLRKEIDVPILDDRNVNDQGINAAGEATEHGNVYGESKSFADVLARLPLLTEAGGRVNRVGTIRLMLSAEIEELGMFLEITERAINLDSAINLHMKHREKILRAAKEINDDMIQMDLLSSAGIVRFSGIATSHATMTGEGDNVSVVDYTDFEHTFIDLQENKAPLHSRIMTGSQATDVLSISASYVAFMDARLQPTISRIADPFGGRAFTPVKHYQTQGQLINGEVGQIAGFRMVVAPHMLHWPGEGATATAANLGYETSNGRYSIYPILALSGEAFTTLGLRGGVGNGTHTTFNTKVRLPGEGAVTDMDPYGKKGIVSINWWYGMLVEHPEWIAVIKTLLRTN